MIDIQTFIIQLLNNVFTFIITSIIDIPFTFLRNLIQQATEMHG